MCEVDVPILVWWLENDPLGKISDLEGPWVLNSHATIIDIGHTFFFTCWCGTTGATSVPRQIGDFFYIYIYFLFFIFKKIFLNNNIFLIPIVFAL